MVTVKTANTSFASGRDQSMMAQPMALVMGMHTAVALSQRGRSWAIIESRAYIKLQ
jgi:hypothetical protein